MGTQSLTIRELVLESYGTALDKGWYARPLELGTVIALIHSELSEALECYRNGNPLDRTWDAGEKPEGFLTELADAYIRIAALVGSRGLTEDFEKAVRRKLAYNKTRPFRHGNKEC